MALSGSLNNQYLISKLVNQKYEPLLNVKVSQKDAEILADIISARVETITKLSINFYDIEYAGYSLTTKISSQNNSGMLSPIAIISSNRSKWIKKTYDEGEKLSKISGPYDNVNDPKALAKGPVPIYAPFRFAPVERNKRRVYIFVHTSEFIEYSKNLALTDLIVVGWKIRGAVPMVGFGASRFAAIEFFKNIYDGLGSLKKVWMFDDNTCFIRKFPTMAVVESQMDKKECAGLGFKGDTVARSKDTFTKLSKEKVSNHDAATKITGSTILQQAVLWNLTLFKRENINFSPLFFSAGEDVSFTLYLTPKQALWYESCTILKSDVGNSEYDNGSGVLQVNAFKKLIGKSFFVEGKGKVPFTSSDVKGKKTLDKIIPSVKAVNDSSDTLENTYSRAIEQILKNAMGKGVNIKNINTVFVFPKEFKIAIINA